MSHSPSEPPTLKAMPDEIELIEQLAQDMVQRWRAGERPVAEEYFERYPELWQNPPISLELIAEELALRTEYSQPATEAELMGRFPYWKAQVLALLECQIALGQMRPRFPETGETIGEFTLRSELGRGGEGRVFLAEQPLLAGRLVVLKLSSLGSCEHLCLARLQHSYIVPLYSAHEFPERALLGLCMPYFGGTTLAALLNTPHPFKDGKALLAALPTGTPIEAAPGSAWFILQRASLPEAVCWIGACLAEALEYAHERGFVHLDVKPSNVLIAGDGTPMLLDFHLAHPPVKAGTPAPEWLGGTPGFMSPEHQAAFDAVQAGRDISIPIDGRADVYTLGVVLKKMLGTLVAKEEATSQGLADILDRCTQANPADRYQTAGTLAADLRRHLADMPLKGVRNRSFAERWQKWRRRQPHVMPIALSMLALLLAGVGLMVRSQRQVEQAELALAQGSTHLTAQRYTEASSTFRNGEALLDWLPLQRNLRTQLRDGRLSAEREQMAGELHRVCESVRPLYAVEVLSSSQAQTAAVQCRAIWDERAKIVEQLEPSPSSDWRTDLLDLGILTAHLESRAAGATKPSHRLALETLAEAETLFGPSRVLQLEKASHARELGLPVPENGPPPTKAWEHLAVARASLAENQLPQALEASSACLKLDPSSFWGYYYRGQCLLRLERATEAIADFSAATALAPQSAWCFYNRGLAYMQANRLDSALADFNQTLALDKTFAQAYLQRATVHHRSQRLNEALADLDQALRTGIPKATVEYERALAYWALNKHEEALSSLQRVLVFEPNHTSARTLMNRIREEKK